MRCYFNLVDGSEVILDREGIEVSGPEEARSEALYVIREQRQADPVAQCEATSCDRFLLRTHARRCWCSTRCGDRVRAARAYARKLERAQGG